MLLLLDESSFIATTYNQNLSTSIKEGLTIESYNNRRWRDLLWQSYSKIPEHYSYINMLLKPIYDALLWSYKIISTSGIVVIVVMYWDVAIVVLSTAIYFGYHQKPALIVLMNSPRRLALCNRWCIDGGADTRSSIVVVVAVLLVYLSSAATAAAEINKEETN